MSNAWDHLPNAKHIDVLIASVKARPKEWSAAYYAARDAAYYAAWDAASNAACKGARHAAWGAARGTTREAAQDAARYTAYYAARGAVWDAILALIVYDDCAYILDSDPGELEILAKFGDERAILLLPACKVFAAIKHVKWIGPVFRCAKFHLSPGIKQKDGMLNYICLAIDNVIAVPDEAKSAARKIINDRLDGYADVSIWLQHVAGIHPRRLSYKAVQTFRHEWLDELIKEFSVND